MVVSMSPEEYFADEGKKESQTYSEVESYRPKREEGIPVELVILGAIAIGAIAVITYLIYKAIQERRIWRMDLYTLAKKYAIPFCVHHSYLVSSGETKTIARFPSSGYLNNRVGWLYKLAFSIYRQSGSDWEEAFVPGAKGKLIIDGETITYLRKVGNIHAPEKVNDDGFFFQSWIEFKVTNNSNQNIKAEVILSGETYPSKYVLKEIEQW